MADILSASGQAASAAADTAAANAAAAATPQPTETPQANVPAAPATVEAVAAKAASGEALTPKEQKVLKEYKLKVNGREKTIKFDPNNDEEVTKYLQKAEASDSKFQEAAEVRKAAMDFIEQLRKNPRKVLSDPNIGLDVRKFAEEILNDEIKEMEKPPEQREREKLQKELEELRAQAKQKDDEAKQAQMDRLQIEHERTLETEISAALDVGGLPKTARTVKHMAEMMMIALEGGINLSASEIAPIVKGTTLSEFKEIVASLSDDQLEDFVGKEVLGRIRKKNLAKVKTLANSTGIKPTGTVSKAPIATPEKKMTIRQFLKA